MRFSLSKDEAAIFPTELGGCPIDYDFKNILWILDVLSDADISEINRLLFALKYFYIEDVPKDGIKLMNDFISGNNNDESKEGADSPVMDFEFDAEEIYCDFLRDYGIDLFNTDMHWRKFLALLSGLSDGGALARKIKIRTMDISDLKGKERAEAQRAKEKVQIPIRYTAQELAEIAEFEKWGE